MDIYIRVVAVVAVIMGVVVVVVAIAILEGEERWGKNCHWLRVKQLSCRLI